MRSTCRPTAYSPLTPATAARIAFGSAAALRPTRMRAALITAPMPKSARPHSTRRAASRILRAESLPPSATRTNRLPTPLHSGTGEPRFRQPRHRQTTSTARWMCSAMTWMHFASPHFTTLSTAALRPAHARQRMPHRSRATCSRAFQPSIASTRPRILISRNCKTACAMPLP